MNAAERATIAKSVSEQIIQYLLAEKSMSLTDLWAKAKDVTEDKVKDSSEYADIVTLSLKYVAESPQVTVIKGVVSYCSISPGHGQSRTQKP